MAKTTYCSSLLQRSELYLKRFTSRYQTRSERRRYPYVTRLAFGYETHVAAVQALIPSAKRTGKTVVASEAPSEADDDELLSEHSLEYDSAIDESELSGSEFEADEMDDLSALSDETDSQADVEYVSSNTRRSPKKRLSKPLDEDTLDQDEEDEEIMVDEAIRQSLRTSRAASSSGAGPSSSRRADDDWENSEAAKRAQAAERRIKNQNNAVDDSGAWGDEADSDEEPLAQKGKGAGGKKKGKATAWKKAGKETVSEMRKRMKEERQQARAAKKAIREEEAALIKKLGRRLTHVSPICIHNVVF
jgi:hypothetical protein